MERLPNDPRTLREVNARFDYEVRAGRAKQAIQDVFARNQARRDTARKDAERAERDHIDDNMDRQLRQMKKDRFNSY